MNYEEEIKTTYKEVTENSNASSKKIEVGIEKINYDTIEMLWEYLRVS